MARRRTFAQVDAAAVARERVGMVRHLRAQIRIAQAWADAGRIDRDEADRVCELLSAFASGIPHGLHAPVDDSRAVQDAVKQALHAMGSGADG